MRVALAQINSQLGDFEKNAQKILDFTQRALAKKCDIVIFPEAALFGYHPFDLLERSELVKAQLKELKNLEKKIPSGILVVFGLFTENKSLRGRPYFNSAAILKKGKPTKIFHKQLLPTGDVFDEARFIQPGDMKKNIYKNGKKNIVITICEDIWAWDLPGVRNPYDSNPLQKLKVPNVELVINLSASPFYPGKLKVRKSLVKKTAAHFKAPMVYANLVGAQDEIVFDGQSFALDKNGNELACCAAFNEDLNVIDFSSKVGGVRPKAEKDIEQVRQALVLGIRDFAQKTGFTKIHLGLSGGIDSAVVACLAVDALGPNNIMTFGMPGPFNDPKSLKLAEALAKNLGIGFEKVSIEGLFQSTSEVLKNSMGVSQFSVVHENVQARLRGMILMAYANHQKSLLLGTSNKSELSCGFATLYGDLAAGLLPIGDLVKKDVYDLAKLYNFERELIPNGIIERAPSAELRPNQTDQDSLPPYEVLDQCVRDIVENCKTSSTKTSRWLIGELIKSEFKRWQAPPILKVTPRAFGRGRRWPIAHSGIKYT